MPADSLDSRVSAIRTVALVGPAGAGKTLLLDALLAYEMPVVEVHLSNIHRRESFRRQSYISLAAQGMICGFQGQGYVLGLRALADLMDGKT